MSRSFTYRLEGDIKRYMNSQPDKEEAAETALKASLPFLKSDECDRVKGQLSYIVQDMKKDRHNGRPIIYNNVEKQSAGTEAEDVGIVCHIWLLYYMEKGSIYSYPRRVKHFLSFW